MIRVSRVIREKMEPRVRQERPGFQGTLAREAALVIKDKQDPMGQMDLRALKG